MIRGIESILLSSENATQLAHFYRDKVGLKVTTEAEMGDRPDNLFGFEFGEGCGLYIADHSELSGTNKDPKRIIFNLEADDIESEVERLEKEGVKQVGQLHHVEGYGQIATFEDLDGNYFQLVQVREE